MMRTVPQRGAPATTPRPWLVLVAMTGSLSMIMLDQTVVTVALPTMTHDLGLSATGQQWVLNAYVLALAALVALGGRLSDLMGGVTTFRIGVSLFFIASVGCGLSPSGGWGEPVLLTARALQGVGAALMVPVSAAIVMAVFPPAQRGRAMAAYTGISQVFLALGPLVGGALTQSLSWRLVFWLNVPVGLAALVLVQIARPDDSRAVGATVRVGSVLALVGGLGLTVFALQQGSSWGWTSARTLACLAVGVALAAGFVVTQLHEDSPLVDVRLFGNRAFLGDSIVLGLVQFGLLPVILFSSLYLQEILGFGPLTAGLAMLPLIGALAGLAQIGGRWYDRSGVRRPALVGLSLAGVGLVAWAASLPVLSYAWQLPGMLVTGAGIGLLMSPVNTDSLDRVTSAERNQASGLVQTVRQLGATLGLAAIGAVVLGIEHRGGAGAATPLHTVDAIVVGFGCAAAVFGMALLAATALIPRATAKPDRVS